MIVRVRDDAQAGDEPPRLVGRPQVEGAAGEAVGDATLGEDLGKCSFREWRLPVKLAAGKHELKVRAVNRIGQSQPAEALWNPPGYMRNVVETVTLEVA